MNLSDYSWLVVVGALAGFVFGFGAGSNDLANAFGTSVGSKTLTLKQAVIIASIWEFAGSMLLGRVNTSTIQGGIADIAAFQSAPEFYAYGMVIALTVAGVWSILSSYLRLQTSSTHSIIGAIIGFAMVYAGSGGVLWYTPAPSSFPPYGGLVPIVVAWFFSPIFCAIASAVCFIVLRSVILRRSWGATASVWSLPFFVFFVFWLCIYFVFTKGAKKTFQADDKSWSDNKSLWIAAASAAGAALLSLAAIPYIFHKVRQFEKAEEVKMEEAKVEEVKVAIDPEAVSNSSSDLSEKDSNSKTSTLSKYWEGVRSIVMHGMEADVHKIVDDNDYVHGIHANAEVFPPKTELVFSYLQVFSACCVMLAHGAGEVGLVAGPLTAIVNIVNTGMIVKSYDPVLWTTGLGSAALVCGLAIYGYPIITTVGVRLCKISPSRGFIAELATALIVLIAAQYGLPVAGSQVIVGGVVGIGLCEGIKGLNWPFFGLQLASWVATLFICGIGSAAIFSAGSFAPCIQMAKQIQSFEGGVSELQIYTATGLNDLAKSYLSSARANQTEQDTVASLLLTIKNLELFIAATKNEISSKVQTADPKVLWGYLYKTLSLMQMETVATLGQNDVYPKALVCNDNSVPMNTTSSCMSPLLVPPAYYGYP